MLRANRSLSNRREVLRLADKRARLCGFTFGKTHHRLQSQIHGNKNFVCVVLSHLRRCCPLQCDFCLSNIALQK